MIHLVCPKMRHLFSSEDIQIYDRTSGCPLKSVFTELPFCKFNITFFSCSFWSSQTMHGSMGSVPFIINFYIWTQLCGTHKRSDFSLSSIASQCARNASSADSQCRHTHMLLARKYVCRKSLSSDGSLQENRGMPSRQVLSPSRVLELTPFVLTAFPKDTISQCFTLFQ